jgi:CRP-like cAMP-binding protein
MKSFNWQDFFRHQPVFSTLTEAELTELLSDEMSQERADSQGTIILREGEQGDSVFLIGSGSVQVMLRGQGDQQLPLSILKAGEFFGEMAVLEHKPRSATVMAREDCTLLEVNGQAFRKLLQAHPDIQSKVQSKMTERVNR